MAEVGPLKQGNRRLNAEARELKLRTTSWLGPAQPATVSALASALEGAGSGTNHIRELTQE
jgi:hypothetical protein